jgi:hypothetical protein
MTVSLADVPKGHEFAETRFELTREWVAQYRAAVEDDSSDPSDAPPLSLATLSIRALLDEAALPSGAIHVSQEMSFSLGRQSSDVVVAKARVASRGERAGWVLMAIELEVEDETGTPMMNGRATITFPAVAVGVR